MKVAVVSDIHGNYHALEAVLAEATVERPDELWCLGDIVGYGPDPGRCCAVIERRATLSLCGNHDLAVIGRIPIAEFNDHAAAAVQWTQNTIGGASRRYLESLEPAAERHGVAIFHASPIDPVWDYVLSEEAARRSFDAVAAQLILVGHSHLALRVRAYGGLVEGRAAEAGEVIDLSPGRWLLNPGSVGQPRGGDPRAAWLMLDFDRGTATFRRTAYPIAKTQEAIRAAGLPNSLATRLELGQ